MTLCELAYLTCPTSMEAVFFKLLQGVYTMSMLLVLLPVMELALTSCIQSSNVS